MTVILSLRELFLRLANAAWQRRYLIAMPILIMPILGLAVGSVTPRHFSASMTLLVQEPTSHNPLLEDLAISTRIKDRMDALVEQVRMQNTMETVARSLGWVTDDTPPEEAERVVARLRANLRFRLIGGEVVEIGYRAPEAAGMDTVLRKASEHFIAQLLAPGQSAVDGSEQFLRDQLESKREELNAAERDLALFKSRNADALPALHTRNVNRLGEIRRQLAEKRSQLAGDKARFDAIKLKLIDTDPIVGQLEKRLVDARGRLSILRARYTDRHSKVVAVLREIAQLDDERAARIAEGRDLLASDPDRLWNMVSGSATEGQGLVISQLERLQEARNQTHRLTEEIKSLEFEEEQLAARVNVFGVVEQRLAALERDVAVRRKVVAQLAERFEMAQVTGSLGRFDAMETVKVINPPVVPRSRTGLPVPLYGVLGVVAGIALGLGLALVVDLLDPSIRRREQVERTLGIPVLTRLPRVGSPTPASRPRLPLSGLIALLRSRLLKETRA
jgi:polysaccharide chain length determinant protein (PEP-CTERM system associated)